MTKQKIVFFSVYMSVSENSGTPQIIHLNKVFHYKPSILGYLYFWKYPYWVPLQLTIDKTAALYYLWCSFKKKEVAAMDPVQSISEKGFSSNAVEIISFKKWMPRVNLSKSALLKDKRILGAG